MVFILALIFLCGIVTFSKSNVNITKNAKCKNKYVGVCVCGFLVSAALNMVRSRLLTGLVKLGVKNTSDFSYWSLSPCPTGKTMYLLVIYIYI